MKKSRSFVNKQAILFFALGLLTYFLLSKVTPLIYQVKTQDSQKNVEQSNTDSSCDEEENINKAKKGVVKIVGDYGIGSGFVISPDGYVVTNYHVIQNEASPHLVFEDGQSFLGKIHGYDPKVDLAVVKITGIKDLTILQWGNSDKLISGETLYAIGYPWADVLKGEVSVTKGAFSAKRRSEDDVVEFIQTDTSLNHGNSGGPLINRFGKVIGVNVAGITKTVGLNFAISQKTAESIIKSLIENPTVQEQPYSLNIKDRDQSTLSPKETVYLFYTYISTRRIDEAYYLLSSNYHRVTTLNEWLKGYENTLNVFINELYNSDIEKPAVYVNLTSVDLVDEKTVFKKWEGEWFLINENGEWKLDDGTIHQVE